MLKSLNDYASFVDDDLLEKISRLAKNLNGATVQHINSTFVGGGVAEILKSLIPVMESVGLTAKWEVIKGNPSFFEVTKAFHNAFHGEKVNINEEMFKVYSETNLENKSVVDANADFVVLHDQQPLGLAENRAKHKGKWIWYCHIDPVNVYERLWNFLRPYAAQCDASIYHLAEYGKNLGNKQFFLPPAIDPLSDKNREVTEQEINEVRERLNIPADRPIIMQVSRFDRLKNPFGLVRAFLKLVEEIPCYLYLAGGAADDDPEGQEVLDELRQMIDNHPFITVLNLSPTSHLEINVLQRLADVIVQNSSREGFGLTVTEALWKGKPVVATPVGGIRKQVIHEQTGLLAGSEDELIACLKRMIGDRELALKLGQQGREHVRKNFITPVYLYNWMVLMDELQKGS